MLKEALGERPANGIIAFFVIVAVIWVLLAGAEKIASLITTYGKDTQLADVIWALGIVIGLICVFSWTFGFVMWALGRKDIQEIKMRLTRIEKHIGLDEWDEKDKE